MEKKQKNLLEISNLTVRYNTDDAVVHAVNDFNLNLVRGEARGLVGETGAGKTTLALSILRLLPERVGEIKSGSIVYDGQELLKLPEAEMLPLRGKRISMIFQDPMTSLNPTQTVGDQILEVLNLHFPEMTRDEKNKRVDEMMTLVGIPPQRKKSFPHEFSGGMKQRVVIAMALVAEPELLLADEPTTALDVTIQAQILRLMNELQEEKGTSIIFITHDLGVINEMADDVAVMYCGQVVEKASARTIFSDCKMSHPYTEGLMFSIPRLDSKDKIEPIPGVVPHPLALPKGCKFAPRCKYCTKKCMEEEPELKDMGNGQLIRCFYPEKEVRRSAAHKEITVNH